MAIHKIEKGPRPPKAQVDCDDCGANTWVTCDYHRQPNGTWEPDEGQIKKKLAHNGWTLVKGKFRCPDCETKRKVVPMQKPTDTENLREPTKRQRIEIFALLADVYDIDAGRYKNNDTDDSVAEVLGVMPGWVSKIREAEFGPDGSNQNIDELVAKIETFEKDAKALSATAVDLIKRVQGFEEASRKKLAEVSALKVELEKIQKALGPRVVKQLGLRP